MLGEEDRRKSFEVTETSEDFGSLCQNIILMIINTENPLNKKVLQYLSRVGKPESQVLASPDSVSDPYMQQGSHPDIVQRVWNEIGNSLPMDCRCLIYGTPALIHPQSGIILAFCNGTQYNLRLITADFRDAIAKGALTRTKWSNGKEMDSLSDLGNDWIFGVWSKDEIKWCHDSYEQLG